MDRFKKILLLYENTPAFEDAKQLALQLVERNDAKLTIMEILPALGDYSKIFSSLLSLPSHLESIQKTAQSALENLVSAEKRAGVDIEITTIRGRIASEATKKVLQDKFDLLIKPTNVASNTGEKLIGPVDMRLLRICPCPIWLVKNGNAKHLKNVLAAIDGIVSDNTRKILNSDLLKLGWDLSRFGHGTLDILNVWSFDAANILRGSMESADFASYETEVLNEHNESLQKFVQDVLPKIELDRLHTYKGRTSECIIRHIENNAVDVLVMGTIARTGVAGLIIGNTAERVLAQIDCSVLALKPNNFVSPINIP